MPFQPVEAPVGGSLLLSALVALLPLLAVFFFLGVLKWKGHWACLAGLGVALIVGVAAFNMPVGMAISSGLHGMAFGIFPITWIVLTAIFYFELTVASGHHDDLMRIFNVISPDPRVLGILIGFCFCALLEALAGFGAPVAIVGVMLIGIGFSPMKAALTVLIGNTFAVPFGAVATPIVTGAGLTDIPAQLLGASISRQTASLVWIVPLLMLLIMDGKRGLRQAWPFGLVVGITYAASTFVSATWISVELTNMIAAIVSFICGMLFLRVWQPKGAEEMVASLHGDGPAPEVDESPVTGKQIAWAVFPYLTIIVVFAVSQLVPVVKNWLTSTNIKINWPGLWQDGEPMVLNTVGEPASVLTYNFQWLSSPGTLLLITGFVIGLIYGMKITDIAKLFGTQVYKLRWTFVTIGSVLGLAYVMNASGQTYTIGLWIAGAGTIFAFLSPILGYIGCAVTGSGTSSTALFASLQQTVANEIGVNQTLLVGANTAGAAVGKMISPQTLAIAATATEAKESDMLSKALPWSIFLIVLLCVLVGLQSTPILGWMLP